MDAVEALHRQVAAARRAVRVAAMQYCAAEAPLLQVVATLESPLRDLVQSDVFAPLRDLLQPGTQVDEVAKRRRAAGVTTPNADVAKLAAGALNEGVAGSNAYALPHDHSSGENRAAKATGRGAQSDAKSAAANAAGLAGIASSATGALGAMQQQLTGLGAARQADSAPRPSLAQRRAQARRVLAAASSTASGRSQPGGVTGVARVDPLEAQSARPDPVVGQTAFDWRARIRAMAASASDSVGGAASAATAIEPSALAASAAGGLVAGLMAGASALAAERGASAAVPNASTASANNTPPTIEASQQQGAAASPLQDAERMQSRPAEDSASKADATDTASTLRAALYRAGVVPLWP